MQLGATVKELKRRITHKEWVEWVDYVNRYGRLDPVRMYDWGDARIAWLISKTHGGKGEFAEFLPHKPQPKSGVGSLDEIIKAFGGMKSGKRRR